MAMPRLPLLTPHPGRRRQVAALWLTLCVLALHLAALSWQPSSGPPPAPPQARLQLRALLQAEDPRQAALSTARPGPNQDPAARSPRPGPGPAPRPIPAPQTSESNPRGPVVRAAAPAAPVERETLVTPDQAETAVAEPGPPWPVYAAALPPAAIRHYRLQRGARSSPARLAWAHDAQGYTLSLAAEGGDLDGLGAASRGLVGPAGLVPERHVERRRGRDQRATNFDLASQTVRGSGGGEPHPWPAGGQDRLSWLLQLAAVLEADASLARAGAQLLLPVAGPRGPPVVWVFTVLGVQDLTLADGRTVSGLALQRAPRHPYDLQVDLWLDPADHHLPLRLRLAAPPGDWESVWLSTSPP